jgi:hypothetical protein
LLQIVRTVIRVSFGHCVINSSHFALGQSLPNATGGSAPFDAI